MTRIASWMSASYLQLNSAKTTILLFAKAHTCWSNDWFLCNWSQFLSQIEYSKVLAF